MRLSEAAGLIKDDVSLEHEHSHIIFKVHPWRRLKTKGSDRIVPLAGEALKYSRVSVVRVFGPEFDLIYWSLCLIWFVILSGVFAMMQAPGFNCLSFNPFSLI